MDKNEWQKLANDYVKKQKTWDKLQKLQANKMSIGVGGYCKILHNYLGGSAKILCLLTR